MSRLPGWVILCLALLGLAALACVGVRPSRELGPAGSIVVERIELLGAVRSVSWYLPAGDATALSEQERAGMKLFRSLKTRCFECHNFPTFADDTFRVIGVPETGAHDRGRAGVPGDDERRRAEAARRGPAGRRR